MFTFTNDSCLQRTKRKKETGKKEKKCKEGRKDEMSITEKETGNPSEKKSRRRGKEKRSDRREEGQRRRVTEREKERKEERKQKATSV